MEALKTIHSELSAIRVFAIKDTILQLLFIFSKDLQVRKDQLLLLSLFSFLFLFVCFSTIPFSSFHILFFHENSTSFKQFKLKLKLLHTDLTTILQLLLNLENKKNKITNNIYYLTACKICQ